MPASVCWACKDSRALCDRVSPCCSKCSSSGKVCQYGLRLSWPKPNSTKRSLTHVIEDRFGTTQHFHQASFVNATSWDIQLHDYLWTSQGLQGHNWLVLKYPHPPAALSWLPIQMEYEERELLDYFKCTAFSMLAIFDPDKKELLSLLLRLALSDNSLPSVAVLQSTLALSSLHRFGLQPNAFQLKARALRTMIKSDMHGLERLRIIQHTAAGMILCHFEMLDKPDASTQWYCHLSEAKNLIDNIDLGGQTIHSEFSRLLNWVEYHTVISKFSLQYWHRSCLLTTQVACQRRKIKGLSYCSHEILQLLYEILETILKPTNSLYHTRQYENSLQGLESRMNNIDLSARENVANPTSGFSKIWVTTLELFKLAALVYLKRASRNFSGTSAQIDTIVDRALIILRRLETFNLAFPLLIFGCEARVDDQRMSILELIERTTKTSNLSSLHGLRNILQQLWVQDDLAADYELDYSRKLVAVISSYHILPTFA